jgi:hypothetical protein
MTGGHQTQSSILMVTTPPGQNERNHRLSKVSKPMKKKILQSKKRKKESKMSLTHLGINIRIVMMIRFK